MPVNSEGSGMGAPAAGAEAPELPAHEPPGTNQALWRQAAMVATRLVGVTLLLGLLVTALFADSGAPLPAGSAAPSPVRVRALDGRVGAIALDSGTPTVVNVWATWCPPCLQEMPAFASVAAKYGPRVRFVGLAVNSATEDVQQVVLRLGIPYDIAHVDDAAVRAWNATSLPSTYIVDGHGHVVWSIRGAIDAALLEEHLAPLVQGG